VRGIVRALPAIAQVDQAPLSIRLERGVDTSDVGQEQAHPLGQDCGAHASPHPAGEQRLAIGNNNASQSATAAAMAAWRESASGPE